MLSKKKDMRVCRYTLAIAILSCSLLCIPQAAANSEVPHEYKIKAAFIYQFILFIEGWKFQQEDSADAEGDKNPDEPIVIGIIGQNPFQDAFQPLKDRKVRSRNVIIKYFKGFSDLDNQDEDATIHPDIENIKQCDLLFVCSSEYPYIKNILGPIRKERILTIADTQGFLEKGGIINFMLEKNRVRFEINVAAAKRAKLTIRSKLLRLAIRVISKDDLEEK
jgi:hypothetical protein